MVAICPSLKQAKHITPVTKSCPISPLWPPQHYVRPVCCSCTWSIQPWGGQPPSAWRTRNYNCVGVSSRLCHLHPLKYHHLLQHTNCSWWDVALHCAPQWRQPLSLGLLLGTNQQKQRRSLCRGRGGWAGMKRCRAAWCASRVARLCHKPGTRLFCPSNLLATKSEIFKYIKDCLPSIVPYTSSLRGLAIDE